MTPFEVGIGLLALLALVVSSGTAALLLMWRKEPPEVATLRRELRDLAAEFSDFADRMIRWQRRDSTRHARDRKAALAEETDDAGNGVDPLFDPNADYRTIKERLRAQLATSRGAVPIFGDGVNEP